MQVIDHSANSNLSKMQKKVHLCIEHRWRGVMYIVHQQPDITWARSGNFNIFFWRGTFKKLCIMDIYGGG